MRTLDWAIVGAVLAALVAAAAGTARYTRSVSAFLAADRCGGRYIIAMANAMAGTGVISLVYWFQLHWETGFTGVWWSSLTEPALIVIALSGWIVYRFRQTRAMTLAQFFEMRYSRSFRIFAGLVAYVSGVVNFGIYPAVSARFFIALCGFPPAWHVAGAEVSTFATVMAALLSVALLFTFLGGQIAVMVTDFLQGALVNVVFVVVAVFLLSTFGWDRISEVLLAMPPGQSLVHPFQARAAAEFDIWYFVIAVVIVFYTFNAWQGTQGYQCCARSPHEAKMAGMLYGWRFRVLLVITVVTPIAVHTLLRHPDFAAQAAAVHEALAAVDAPTAEERATLQNEMRMPVALAAILPAGLLGLLCAALLATYISTDDTYLHSWGSILVQDVVLPLRGRRALPLSPRAHLWLLRGSILGVAVFIYVFSLVARPTQLVAMFMAITGAVFVAGAGACIIGGLYWKRGTAAGAWAAMTTGMTLSVLGVVAKQVEPRVFTERLDDAFWFAAVGLYFKEGLSGQELAFWAIVVAVAAYVGVSLLTPDPRIDMDRLLHRGAHAIGGEESPAAGRSRTWLGRLVVNPHFTRHDRIVAAVSIGWPLAWTVVLGVVSAWNLFAPWPDRRWAGFWHVWVWVFVGGAAGVTVWLTVGGALDMRWLFRHLRIHRADPADDGRAVRAGQESESEMRVHNPRAQGHRLPK